MKRAIHIEVAFLAGVFVGGGIVALATELSPDAGRILKEMFIKSFGLWVAIAYAYPVISLSLSAVKVAKPMLTPEEEAVGRTIGYIERFLAFCFILDEADGAIAMLITAKGVYRLHEAGGRPDDEGGKESKTFYTMIGTFASIAYAIAVAFATRRVLTALE